MTENSDRPTVAMIEEYFGYDPANGDILWKKKPNRNIRIGDAAGFLWYGRNHSPYIRIGFRGRWIFAHLVAFVLMTGRYPVDRLDHQDGDGTNNKWRNIREATAQTNGRNQRINSRNTSGHMGVDFHRAANKWRARIIVGRTHHHLGVFATQEDAIAARKTAEIRFGFHANHGRAK